MYLKKVKKGVCFFVFFNFFQILFIFGSSKKQLYRNSELPSFFFKQIENSFYIPKMSSDIYFFYEDANNKKKYHFDGKIYIDKKKNKLRFFLNNVLDGSCFLDLLVINKKLYVFLDDNENGRFFKIQDYHSIPYLYQKHFDISLTYFIKILFFNPFLFDYWDDFNIYSKGVWKVLSLESDERILQEFFFIHKHNQLNKIKVFENKKLLFQIDYKNFFKNEKIQIPLSIEYKDEKGFKIHFILNKMIIRTDFSENPFEIKDIKNKRF